MAHIGVMPTRTSVVVTSSNGENGTISAATERQAGVMTATQVAVLNALAQKMGMLVIEGDTPSLPPPLPEAAAPAIDLSAYAKKTDIPAPVDLSFVHQRIEAIEQQVSAVTANSPQIPAEDTPAYAVLARELDDVRLAISDLSRGWDAQQEIVSGHIKTEFDKLPPPPEPVDLTPYDARIRAIEERVLAVEERPVYEQVDLSTLEARLARIEAKVLRPVIDLSPVLERIDTLEQQLGVAPTSTDFEARLTAIEQRFAERDDPLPAFLGGGSPSITADLERDVARLSEIVNSQAEVIRQLSGRPDFSAHVVRYDLALRARNGNVEAMALMSQEAEALQTTMDDVISQIIGERGRIENLVMRGGKS